MSEEGNTEYFLCLADTLMKEKRYDDAVILYRKLVDMHPGEDSFLLSLAWAYHDSGKIDEAIDCFERLLSIELQQEVFTGFAFDELVRIFKEKGAYERLVDMCERVVASQPDDFALMNDLGDAYLKAGRPREAADVYKKMTEMEPNASAPYCGLGNALVASGDLDGAEEAYMKAVEIDPSETGVFYSRLAHVYVSAGHAIRAEKVYRKCLEFQFNEPLYHCGLGDILIKQGKVNDALDEYKKAVQMNSASGGAYYNRLGNALAREHYYLQAIEAFKKAITVDPHNPFYYVHLADSYTALGLSDLSEETYVKAKSLK
ncbi:MAG: tetratricopeptide repeat protein [Syntrophaceae bacterium]